MTRAKRGPYKRSKLLFGVGINDADYATQPRVDGVRSWVCPFFITWRNMLNRAYGRSYKKSKPSYVGVSVCKDWKTFSRFKSWMEKQDWFGKHLDKDVLRPGNKLYSPDTCRFISPALNAAIKPVRKDRNGCPQGVSYIPRLCKYSASLAFMGKRRHIGVFKTISEAATAHNEVKACNIEMLLKIESDPAVLKGMHLHIDLYREGEKT